jgi:hypothetical protein
VMLTAIRVVHWPNGFFNGAGGYEFNLTLLAAVIALTATGPGRFSIDRAIGWDDDITGAWWALGVAVAALVISFVTVNGLRRRERFEAAPAA